jgi:uncharacterized repeat protein (TIGR03803 family)
MACVERGRKSSLFVGCAAVAIYLSAAVAANAQASYTVLHSFFDQAVAAHPFAPPIRGSDGYLYGTTWKGGVHDRGTLFRMSENGAITVLHSFSGEADALPSSALVEATDGNLYGTTVGMQATGTVFRWTRAGVLEIVYAFPPGCRAPSALVEGLDGHLYGTCQYGTALGSAFRVTKSGVFTLLHTFTGGDGASPRGLATGLDGNFYGVLNGGGTHGVGAIFRMTPAGVVSVIHYFVGTDGGFPTHLIQASEGSLIVATQVFGAGGRGTVVRLAPNGAFSVLRAFSGGATDGALPNHVLHASDGHIYGTTTSGGPYFLGGLFRVTLDGDFAFIRWFGDPPLAQSPQGMVQGNDSRLYISMSSGGSALLGAIFASTLSGDAIASYPFLGTGEGASLAAQLIQARDGLFYGVTGSGGTYNRGTVFRMTPAGDVTTLHAFTEFEGRAAAVALIEASDGYLYGASANAVFRLGLDGSFEIPQFFLFPKPPLVDGIFPRALLQASDGNLYGTTARGGTEDRGSVFRLTLDGRLTILWSFSSSVYGGGRSLIQASDGNLYGTTYYDGIFRLTLSGDFTLVHTISPDHGSFPTLAGQAADGYLYGATLCSGSLGTNGGTVFRLSLTGVFTPLAATGTICSDYGYSSVDVALGRDGNLYGTVWGGRFSPFAAAAYGVAFAMTPSTNTTILHRFDARAVSSPLLQARDGNLYGGVGGGEIGKGALFRIDLPALRPPAPTISVLPAGLNRAALTWRLVPGATSYTVTRIGPSGEVTVLARGLTAPAFTDATAMRGGLFSYVVIAENQSGESLPSAPATFWNSLASRTPTITTARDFDGDRKADLTVYRSSDGQWLTQRSSNGEQDVFNWGAPLLEDRPVPADYDGDGRADIAVYRETTGQWFIRKSSTLATTILGWGSPILGDVPVPADYDGDGLADIAVYRATTGEWFVHLSDTEALRHGTWGAPSLGDVPVPADYDGDGAADLGVYRTSTGEWFIQLLRSGTVRQIEWGAPALDDLPVPADYDGDGHTDIAVYRAATGEWFAAFDSGGSISLGWGAPALGDIPAPADFDGDGRAELAVYRFSTGEWFTHPASTAGTGQRVRLGVPYKGDSVHEY